MKYIIDTDIGPDCDDAAALALALMYEKQGHGELIGVMHCTSSPYGVGAIRRICDYYNKELEVGTLKAKGFLHEEQHEKYNKRLAMQIDEDRRDAEDAVKVYRRLLSEADDQGVEIIAIGPVPNLANLLESAADTFSPLTGRELVEKKVSRLVMMAGRFDYVEDSCITPAAEWNVLMDIPSMQKVAEEWPGTIICTGWEIGDPILVGKRFYTEMPEDNPVRQSYDWYTSTGDRMSWDLTAVEFAMLEETPRFNLSEAGVMHVDDEGVTHWRAEKGGSHYYMKFNEQPDKIASYYEDVLTGVVS